MVLRQRQDKNEMDNFNHLMATWHRWRLHVYMLHGCNEFESTTWERYFPMTLTKNERSRDRYFLTKTEGRALNLINVILGSLLAIYIYPDRKFDNAVCMMVYGSLNRIWLSSKLGLRNVCKPCWVFMFAVVCLKGTLFWIKINGRLPVRVQGYLTDEYITTPIIWLNNRYSPKASSFLFMIWCQTVWIHGM